MQHNNNTLVLLHNNNNNNTAVRPVYRTACVRDNKQYSLHGTPLAYPSFLCHLPHVIV